MSTIPSNSATSRPTVCECCPNAEFKYLSGARFRTGIILSYAHGMWVCPSCKDTEDRLRAENMTAAKQEARVLSMNDMIDRSRQIDQTINVRSDVFNAQTVAIADLKKAIDADPTVENKNYKLAEVLLERFNHFKAVIFELTEKTVEATNNQRAIQQHLNTLSNQLHSEERDRLKISDINYKPSSPATVKPRAIKAPKKAGFDKVALKKFALELGVSESTLQMVCTARNMTPEQAAAELRASIAGAKAAIAKHSN